MTTWEKAASDILAGRREIRIDSTAKLAILCHAIDNIGGQWIDSEGEPVQQTIDFIAHKLKKFGTISIGECYGLAAWDR